jgi:hypothetical protein
VQVDGGARARGLVVALLEVESVVVGIARRARDETKSARVVQDDRVSLKLCQVLVSSCFDVVADTKHIRQ